MTGPTERDFTNPTWGHNLNITRWDAKTGTGRGACWITPSLKNGDVVRVRSQRGSMRLRVSNVEWVFGVDDMYNFDFSALEAS
jgi:anaerobic selenocysteine-containing dehydrogenase